MTTAQDLIDLSLRDSGVLGVGQTALTQDYTDSLRRLNMMLSQWSRRRWLVYHLVDTSAASTGAASYTLGTAQTFNIARTDRLDAAYVVKSGTSTPMRIINSREEFDRITAMAQTGAPEYVFYDSNYPTGNVYFWPIPDNTYTLHVLTKVQLQQFASISDVVSLPPEYEAAIYANLMQLFRIAYRLPPDDDIEKLAEQTLLTLQEANLQDSNLRMPKKIGATVGDLINLALEDSGVFGAKRQPSYQDTQDALWRLNMTLAQWMRRRWLVYHLVDVVAACDGSTYYTVGPGQDFDVTRPAQIASCFIRQVVSTNPTPIDWPLTPIMSYEEYSQIALKTLQAAPSEYYFYDSGWPTGKLYPWPLPNSQYELHIQIMEVLQTFTSIDTAVNLPPEYELALHDQLVLDTVTAYGGEPSAIQVGKAKASLNTIRKVNFQVGRLSMPAGINKGPAYNIYADRGS